MTERPNSIPPPITAGPARRVFHALLSLAGWALFIYWWWIVFHRVSRHEIRFTLIFIAVSLAAIVLATFAWAWHNLRIFERKGPRRQVRDATSPFSRDGVGRAVTYSAIGPDRRMAPVVYVRLAGDGKRYDVYDGLTPRNGGKSDGNGGAAWRAPGQRPKSEA